MIARQRSRGQVLVLACLAMLMVALMLDRKSVV